MTLYDEEHLMRIGFYNSISDNIHQWNQKLKLCWVKHEQLTSEISVFERKIVDILRGTTKEYHLKHARENDHVIALVARVSGCESSFYSFKSQLHGYVLADCIVGVAHDGQRVLNMTIMELNRLIGPYRKEKYCQEIDLKNYLALENLGQPGE